MKPRFALFALHLLAVLSVALFAAPAQAQSKDPIDISAAKLTVDQKTGTATFSGGVTVVQGATTLTGNQLVARYGKELETLTATGNVRLVRTGGSQPETATGATAVYKPGTEVLTMSGGVTLTRGGNTLSGNTLTYNLRSGQINLGGGGRVSGRFQSGGATGAMPQIKTGATGTTVSRSLQFSR